MSHTHSTGAPARFLTPLQGWALSLGCCLGWGAFVMPGSMLLEMAGPVGTAVALAIGGLCMVVIAASYRYMAVRHPDSGGAYSYTKHVFGFDHTFLCAWSIGLAYVSIMWANATAIVLISRFLLGPVFQVGFHYVVAGYDVYAGEIAITLATLGAFGGLSCLPKRVTGLINTIFACFLLGGTLLCLFIVMGAGISSPASFNPPLADNGNNLLGIVNIVALAPWAYVGFEATSHAMGDATFKPQRLFGILTLGVVAGAIIYISTTLVSVMGTPQGYGSWKGYIANLGDLDGLAALPVFNALQRAAGPAGLALLGCTVLCAISTSLLGLYRSASSLFLSLAQDEILPERFARTTPDGVPRNAILLIMAISVFVPFVGRAAIGWIVDVTSVSAAITYCYVSACAARTARLEGDRGMRALGWAGIVISAFFFVFPLIPNFWSTGSLAPESYFILAAWSGIGLFVFRVVFQRDKRNRFGKSTIVWIAMLFLLFFSSTMWVRQESHAALQEITNSVSTYYLEEYSEHGLRLTEREMAEERAFINERTAHTRNSLLNSSFIQMLLVGVSLALMFNIYSLMRRREKEVDLKRIEAEQSSKAKTTFLSNMSHDIRTPMNAIIGYTTIAQREGLSLDEVRGYLRKIDSSSKHLLALINDVLEMSRIESGKIELEPAPCDLVETMGEVHDMFATQMEGKNITFTVDAAPVRNSWVMCDKNRLNRVLLNLLSNAYKFTPEGGSVTVNLLQTSAPDQGKASYELRVRDTGIGMTPEFAERIFEAFERERTAAVSGIEGTGLGMAITKAIVDLMGGSIQIATAPNEGTEFVIMLEFELADESLRETEEQQDALAAAQTDFSGKRVLLVEDNEINREIALLILEEAGFELECATNGLEALNMVKEAEPGHYDVILTDVQMPVMNGYDEARAIRALPDPVRASTPIFAVTANAFSEDVQAAYEAGMNGHLAKPLDVPKVMHALAKLFVEQQEA